MQMFYVTTHITSATIKRFITFLHEDFAGDKLVVYINTDGGCLGSALAMYEILRTMAAQGIEVTTQLLDGCHSAGMVVFLAGDQRYAVKHASFLIHEAALEESEQKQAEGYKATYKALQKATRDYYEIITERSGLTLNVIKKRVKAAKGNDWYFYTDEALEYKIATHLGFHKLDFTQEIAG